MKHNTVSDIKALLEHVTSKHDPILQSLEQDTRKSVQQLIIRKKKLLALAEKQWADHIKRLEIETEAYQKGAHFIAGVDEVGRGPLAGPVVTAAVILPRDCDALVGVNDSKQLSHDKRAAFDTLIRQHALAIAITVTDENTIDRLNIFEATRHSMLESVNQLSLRPDLVLLDAMQIDTDIPQIKIIKGDQRSLSIAAASIVAKVYRDNLMIQYAQQYPEFHFDQHMGYGTTQHLDALAKYGKTPIHRNSFAPVAHTTQIYGAPI